MRDTERAPEGQAAPAAQTAQTAPAGSAARAPRKVRPGWAAALGVVATAFVILAVLKGLSFVLPAPEQVQPATQVTLGAKGGDGWSVTLTDASGAPLKAQVKSTGFIGGWNGPDYKVYSHRIPTPEDPVLAVNRIIRASFMSVMPDGKGEAVGGATVVRLDAAQSKAVDPDIAEGDVLAGVLVKEPAGLDGDSLVVVVEGNDGFVNRAVEEIVSREAR